MPQTELFLCWPFLLSRAVCLTYAKTSNEIPTFSCPTSAESLPPKLLWIHIRYTCPSALHWKSASASPFNQTPAPSLTPTLIWLWVKKNRVRKSCCSILADLPIGCFEVQFFDPLPHEKLKPPYLHEWLIRVPHQRQIGNVGMKSKHLPLQRLFGSVLPHFLVVIFPDFWQSTLTIHVRRARALSFFPSHQRDPTCIHWHAGLHRQLDCFPMGEPQS